MELILKEDVQNLGFKDEIVSVKNGYGRNFLIPQGKAIMATVSARKVLAENLKQKAFKEKSNLKDKNQIEIAFHALYMKLLMKLQKKEISPNTEDAFDSMRILLAYLSKSYHKMKNGDLDFLNN